MNRKDFITSLGLGSLFFLTPMANKAIKKGKMKPPTNPQIYRNYLRGIRYYDISAASRKLKKNLPLRLRREADNPHDKYAIEVYFKEKKLGYIPRYENKVIALLMDHKFPLEAYVGWIDRIDGEITGIGISIHAPVRYS